MMAKINGKLHYSYPDFFNFISMATREGVRKAQKGLHLNEDIYAGLQPRWKNQTHRVLLVRKGPDLGFGSILNFNTKIGTGMGEQMPSREYYYMRTQLPLDRFLTFYYAHSGFHINNVLNVLSVQLSLLSMLFIGSIASSVEVCPEDGQADCVNLTPVYDWIKRFVLSIFIVFFIAFLPLFLQELMERGLARSNVRLGKHFLSLLHMFEWIVRVAVIAIGPMTVNTGVLLAILGASLFLVPCMNMCCTRFGSIMAVVARAIALISQIAFIEALWALEAWNTSHSALGINAAVSVQQFAFRALITFFLTRELKADEAKRAWWTGKWHDRG
ncbi:1,3-beta-D-glucan synthase [Entomortierella chlamydospora]|nr:1,3-beta-D-glucan synthase [Entomortierella chlamydospora]